MFVIRSSFGKFKPIPFFLVVNQDGSSYEWRVDLKSASRFQTVATASIIKRRFGLGVNCKIIDCDQMIIEDVINS